jgi:predicted PurR-regulated permease PerM
MGGDPVRVEMGRWTVRGTGFAVGVVIVAMLAWALMRATNVIVLIAISVLLASGLEPAIGWFRTRTGLPRAPTILVVYAAFFALVAVLILLVVPSALDQLRALSDRLPALLDSADGWAKTQQPPISDVLERLISTLRTAVSSGPKVPQGDQLIAAGAAAADVIISVISVLALTFFWLTGHQRLQRFALAMLPATTRHGVRDAWNEVETRMGLWVRGQLTLMAAVFAMTTVAYFVIGLEAALFLGVFAGVAEAIPIVGPAIGAVPALIVAAASGQVQQVVLVALVYVAIQVFEGNVLVPMVMRSAIGVPPFIVMVSLLVGTAIAGIVGALLAVPFSAALVVILERAQARDAPVPLESAVPGSAPEEPSEQDPGTPTLPDGKRPATPHAGSSPG